MKNRVLSIAIITISLSGAVAKATELPSYELMGFPIAPHQLSVVGPANIKEQLPSPTLTMAGMPVSPHQVSVLTRRPRETEDLTLAAVQRSSTFRPLRDASHMGRAWRDMVSVK
jgi:hypothetical protein